MPDNTAYTIVAPTARAVDDSLKRKSERAHWRTLRRAKWMKKKNRQKEERKRGRENTIEKRKCNVRWLVFFSFSSPSSSSSSFSLSPVRSSFQCRCWQQQQCSSSSHVNGEEYRHCSDLKIVRNIFFPCCLTNSCVFLYMIYVFQPVYIFITVYRMKYCHAQ